MVKGIDNGGDEDKVAMLATVTGRWADVLRGMRGNGAPAVLLLRRLMWGVVKDCALRVAIIKS